MTGRTCTPYELFYGKVPDISALRVFGCHCYVKQRKGVMPAMAPQSKPGIFVGYEPTSKAYRVVVDSKVQISRNVTFIENKFGLPNDEDCHVSAAEE